MCKHENFVADVSVNRLQENDNSLVISGYTADMRIKCSECGQAFEFVGVEGGVSPFGPRVSIDSTELRIPIKPCTGQLIFEGNNAKLN